MSTSAIPTIYKCTRGTCTGAKEDDNSSSCWTIGSIESDACDNDELLCKDGSIGPLCGSCSSGWTYESASSTCIPCNGLSNASDIAIIVVVAILMLLAVIIFFRPPICLQRLRNAAVIFLQGFNRASLKICWNTYQIVSTVPLCTGSVNFPEPFSTWLQDLSFMSFDFFSSDCIFLRQSYYRKVYITAFLPLIFAALIVFGCAVYAKMRPVLEEKIKKTILPNALVVLSCKQLSCHVNFELKSPMKISRINFFDTPPVCYYEKIAWSLLSQRSSSFQWNAQKSMTQSTLIRTPALIVNRRSSSALRPLQESLSRHTCACRCCGHF